MKNRSYIMNKNPMKMKETAASAFTTVLLATALGMMPAHARDANSSADTNVSTVPARTMDVVELNRLATPFAVALGEKIGSDSRLAERFREAVTAQEGEQMDSLTQEIEGIQLSGAADRMLGFSDDKRKQENMQRHLSGQRVKLLEIYAAASRRTLTDAELAPLVPAANRSESARNGFAAQNASNLAALFSPLKP
jgi:hypothetical protein